MKERKMNKTQNSKRPTKVVGKKKAIRESYEDLTDEVWEGIENEITAEVRKVFPDFNGGVYFDDSRAWSLYILGNDVGLPVSKFGAFRNYLGGGVRGGIANNGRAQDGTVELGEFFAKKLAEIEDIINSGSEDEPDWDKPTGVLLKNESADPTKTKEFKQTRKNAVKNKEFDTIEVSPLGNNWVKVWFSADYWGAKNPATYVATAKIFPEPSKEFGINGGRISKLNVQLNNKEVADYDRGWDVQPKGKDKEFVDELIRQLEEHAKTLKEGKANMKKSINESTNINLKELADFIKGAVEGLQEGTATNYRYMLDDRLAVFVGWSEGYGSELRDDCIQDKDDPDWAINAGIKVWTSDDMWTDFDYLNFPYYESGEVVDYSLSITPEDANDNYMGVAQEMADGYDQLKDLEIDESGLILNATNESCSKNKSKKRAIKEQVSDEAYDVAEIMSAEFEKMGDTIYMDDFDEQFALAIRKVFGIDNIWEVRDEPLPNGDDPGDFEVDVRGILAFDGWETQFEGDLEGGLVKVKDFEFDGKCALVSKPKDLADVEATAKTLKPTNYIVKDTVNTDNVNSIKDLDDIVAQTNVRGGNVSHPDAVDVIKVVTTDKTYIIDPEGYKYARYVGIEGVYGEGADDDVDLPFEAVKRNETKKMIRESKAKYKVVIKESYGDSAFEVLADGTKVSAVGTTRSTRTYNYEDVEFRLGGRRGSGSYRWMNRPWQSFDFAEALRSAMIDAGVDANFAKEVIREAYGLESAIKYFADHYKADGGAVEESKKPGKTKVKKMSRRACTESAKALHNKLKQGKVFESITITIDEDEAIDRLMERLEYWTDDSTTHELYRKMYESYVYGGVFDGSDFDVMAIVDNDYVNYCEVVAPGDDNYDAVKKLYDEEGCCDISTEDAGFSFIEAETEVGGEEYFLCRW